MMDSKVEKFIVYFPEFSGNSLVLSDKINFPEFNQSRQINTVELAKKTLRKKRKKYSHGKTAVIQGKIKVSL